MKSLKENRLVAKLRPWIQKHKKALWIVGAIILVIITGVITYLILYRPTTKDSPASVTPPPPPTKYYSPLTGNLVDNEADTKNPVTGVMIENSPDARPQSGLKESGVVFEAIAEGGITRFLVLYQQEKPQMVGPVRSLRLYDVEWLAAFNAGIAHVGGSAAALSEVRNGSYRDLDQFFNSGSFWRASDRYAPHNVYTSFAKLDELNKAKDYETSSFTGFTRTDGKPVAEPNATNINLTVSSYLYNPVYTYNSANNNYTRSQGGAVHTDRESGEITPSVVIAMWVDESTTLEDGYRENIQTIGSGKAVIFQNGTAIEVTWNKKSKTDQITFSDAEGNDVPLIRGQTWITAVPNGRGNIQWQ